MAQHTAGESATRSGDQGPTSLPPRVSLIFQSPLNEAVHELWRTNRRAQNLDAIWAPHAPSLALGGEGRARACTIPHSRFARVELDPSPYQQLLFKEIVPVTCPDGRQRNVHVIKVCEEGVFQSQPVANFAQRVVDPQTEQQWHERVSLFTAFSLLDPVSDPCAVFLPRHMSWFRRRWTHEGQQSLETGDTVQLGGN